MKKRKRKVIKSQGGMIEMKVYERLIADELKVLVILASFGWIITLLSLFLLM